jgi:geranylgeranyl diphosphate synthase type I
MTVVPHAVTADREMVEAAMRAAVERLDPRMRRVAAYHFGWVEADGSPPAGPAGGKALRPALALLSGRAAGVGPARAVPAAVAVEFVHAFSLLHDDVMDDDRMRRHRPAAWTVFGVPAAILAGDALLALAEEVLLDRATAGAHRAARCIASTTRKLIAGQALDLGFETRSDVSLDECTVMSMDKTAALFACSCAIGAVLAEAPNRLALALSGFGEDLGLAFQLVDDLLGIWGRPEVTGKPVLNDLRSRKKSLPVTAALGAGTPASARLAELYSRPEPLTEDQLVLAAALIEEAGGRAWAEQAADARVDSAAARLEDAGIPDGVREEFLAVARFVTARDY